MVMGEKDMMIVEYSNIVYVTESKISVIIKFM